jgi:hypothetical protein
VPFGLSELFTPHPVFYVWMYEACRVADRSMQEGSAWALWGVRMAGFGHHSVAVVFNTRVQLSVVASSILGD